MSESLGLLPFVLLHCYVFAPTHRGSQSGWAASVFQLLVESWIRKYKSRTELFINDWRIKQLVFCVVVGS